MSARIAAVAWVLLAAACGGGSSPSAPAPAATAPATPAPAFAAGTVLTFVSGETAEPVGGARIAVGAASYGTDASGQVVLGESVPVSTTLAASADEFLERRVLLRSSSESRFTLWPRRSVASRGLWSGSSGLDERWTQELVYTDWRYCGPEKSQYTPGTLSLRRARSGTAIPISVAPGAFKRDLVEQAVRAASDLANSANQGRVVFQYADTSAPPAGIVVEVLPNPNPSADFIAQFVATTDSEGYITGGRVQFAADPVARTDWSVFETQWWFLGEKEFIAETVAHELGHALGLWHSFVDSTPQGLHWGVMGTYTSDCKAVGKLFYSRTRDFAPAEKLAMSLMAQRRPGNTYPDSEGGVRSSDAAGSTVVCRLGGPPLE